MADNTNGDGDVAGADGVAGPAASGGDPVVETEHERVAQPLDGAARPRLPFVVVGVGASAGGLEAYTEFLEHVRPDSGMAYVLIQHLSPKHESLMAELLGKHTKMPVLQVEDEMEVAADHVYIIRPGFTMTIHDGRLHLGESAASAGHRRPVDDFFRSLAEEQRERAVAVILSGTGSNGTAGAAAIKAVGGLCVAQDPESAKFAAMPRSLIDAGLADAILKPSEIFDFVAAFASHPYAAGEPQSPETVARHDRLAMAEVLSVLRTRVRHDFTGYKKPTLVRRIQRRMSLMQQSRMSDYVRALRQSPTEAQALADDLMIHVTGFFRDPDVWDSLQTRVVEPLVRERDDQASIRCWVTACSSGEEAYTLGILLLEASEAVRKRFNIKIFATDTAERSLSQARQGIFPGGIESEISPARLERFFDKFDAFYHVKRDLRELVVFAPQNVLQDPPFSRLDIVTCRNFLIYIEPDVQQRVLQMLHFGLRDGGAMLLGNSEAIHGSEELFESIDKKSRLYRRIGPTRHGTMEFPFSRGTGRRSPAVTESDGPAAIPRLSLAQMTQRVLLDHFTPAAVVIDRQNRIVYYHGSTDRYLEHPRGEPTRDLLVLAREEIRGPLRSAISKAFADNERVDLIDGRIGSGDTRTRLTLTVAPLDPAVSTVHFLVSFTEHPDPQPAPILPGQEVSAQLTEALRRAREELQSTVEELQTSNEEMKASHEEITSVNEELQSANEELETSKEELQSLNEELTTVNAQLQAKMDELERTSNDLTSLLSSTDIAVIFLDTQFRIRRFTPAVRDLIELIPADIGRPLSDLNRKFTDPSLVADARLVLERLIPREVEIVSHSARWYTRRVLPYRTGDNRIDGVVVTFVDVTARKTVTDALRLSEVRHRSLVSSTAVGICELDVDGTITYCNDRHAQLVGRTREEMVAGMKLQDLSHPDDKGLCRSAQLRLFETGEPYVQEKRYLRPTGEVVWVNTFVDVMRSPDGQITGAVDVAIDVTERRLAVEAHRVAEERLRFNAEASGVGDWEMSLPSRAIYLSMRARELMKLSDCEVTDFDRLLLVVYPDDRKAVSWAADQALDPDGDGLYEVEFRLDHTTPAVWIEARGRTVFEDTGVARRVLMVHGTMQDITARKETEFLRAVVLQSEQAARAEAEAANASKDQFLANASHELRTPLSAILLWSGLLQGDGVDADSSREGLAAIEHSAKAQQKLIEDLMDSARFSAGKVKLELQPTDLRAVVASAVDTLRPAADAKEVEVRSDLGDDVGQVKADGARLQQVVWNLVSNALKFTPAGGRVDVRLLRRGKQVEIGVSDTGVGIDADVVSEIFTRFRQADPSATRRHGGLGLGLAISRQLVELHGGTIAAASDGPGKGATFTVLLPLPRRAAARETQSPTAATRPDGLSGVRVLLVEDDTQTRDALARVLTKAGAAVEAVGHVDHALAAIAREMPGVLVSDIGLPDKDGHALIRAVRAGETPDGPRLPAIALSAFDRPHAQASATESGFDTYLAKPIDPKRLLAAIRDVLALA